MTVNRPPSATGEAFQTLREITLPSRPNAAAPPPIGAMRLAKTAMLAAGALAAAMPASAETTTEPACCLEVAEDAAGAGTFLVNVTVRTNEAKRNQNRLPTVVVFDDALDVSDDLTMRPFGVVDCTRRKQAPPGTTGNNASHNYFECTSQYSDFFFAQFKVAATAGPRVPSARVFDTWCGPAKASCPVQTQLEDESGMIAIGPWKVSTTTLIIVCTIIGVVLGLAIFLLMRWKARRAHERGLVEIEQARRRGEDVESQLKSRAAVGIAIGPEKSLLQRTKSGGFKDEEVLTTVRLDGDESAPMRSPPLVEPPGASITVQRSLSKHALARSMSQYGSNSELNKALDMVPLHQQRQERRATMTNWASSKRLPESTILVIKDPRPPTPTNLSSSDLVEPSLRRSDSGTHPPHPNRAQTASPTRPSALPQKLVQQLPPVTLASTAASAAHTAVPKPQQPRATGLAAPVSLAQTHAAGSAAERSTSPTPTPAPTTPSVSPPHPTNSANPLSLPVSAGSMRRPAGRPKTGNEYVTTHVSMSIKKDGGAQ